MSPQRRILRSSVSMCSPATYRSRSVSSGSTRSLTCRTTSPKTTRAHPFLTVDSCIERFLASKSIERVHQGVHPSPELPAIRLERGPRRLEVVVAIVTRAVSDGPDVARDRQVAVSPEHFLDRHNIREARLIGEGPIGGDDTSLVLRLQEALGPLPCDLVHGVDEEDLAPPIDGLLRTAEHHTSLHGRVVEEVGAEAENAFEQV